MSISKEGVINKLNDSSPEDVTPNFKPSEIAATLILKFLNRNQDP